MKTNLQALDDYLRWRAEWLARDSVTPARPDPDWPLACPRCKREHSAVLLFQTWDCQHGCFK
jgi:hypothetical protein